MNICVCKHYKSAEEALAHRPSGTVPYKAVACPVTPEEYHLVIDHQQVASRGSARHPDVRTSSES